MKRRVQFTSTEFTQRLQAAQVRISWDGRGRALDNIFVERLWRSVKYEEGLWWSHLSRQFEGKTKTKHNRSRISVLSARIDLRWRVIVQRLMKPLVIVKREVRSQVAHRVWNALVIFDVHLLVFDTAP